MSVKPDKWIRRMSLEHKMIEPFTDRQVREGVISYGVSSYGYDIRVANEFRIFTNVNTTIVDPKNFDPRSLVEFKGDVCIVPPNPFALARSIEYFRIPRNVLEWRVDPASGHQHPDLTGRENRVVLICGEGFQSSLAASTLHELGFTGVTDVVGGFDAWRNAGLPVDRP